MERQMEERQLSFYASESSPETAPIQGQGNRHPLDARRRAVDGPLKGKELTWVNSVQCRWYAWQRAPETGLYLPPR